jgi:hypothetical protein
MFATGISLSEPRRCTSERNRRAGTWAGLLRGKPCLGVAKRRYHKSMLIRTAKPRLVVLFLLAFLSGLTHCSAPKQEIPLTRLSSDFQPLRSQFNRDAGRVRLLLLLDPT